MFALCIKNKVKVKEEASFVIVTITGYHITGERDNYVDTYRGQTEYHIHPFTSECTLSQTRLVMTDHDSIRIALTHTNWID